MQWRRVDAWHYKSTDGYFISIAGSEGSRVYTAWVPCDSGERWHGRSHKPVLYTGAGDDQDNLRRCVDACRQHRDQGEDNAAA